MKLMRGDLAPTFHLTDQNGNGWSLGDFRGHFLVLFFYLEDGTSECTKQVEGFRDAHDQFKRMSAKVIGISPDSGASHREFAARCRLPFNLLSDEELEAAGSFGVLAERKNAKEPIRRATFLIGPDGTVLKVYSDIQDATNHAAEILEELKEHVILPAGG